MDERDLLERAMRSDVLVILVIVAAGLVSLAQVGRLLRTHWLHRTIRKALSAESATADELIAKLGLISKLEAETGGGDGRSGAILLAVGAALIGFGIVQGDDSALRLFGGGAFFPLAVGAVLVFRARRNASDGAGR
jgi:hypothetical protein